MYNKIMKKLFLVLIVFLLSYTYCSAMDKDNIKKNAFKDMVKSHQAQHDVCINIANNFRIDHRFSGYIREKCLLYESERQRLLDTIFPITNKGDQNYKDQYPVILSNFAINMNTKEIENYRFIVEEYCKYNKYKFEKKDPQACSQQRIDKIFNI